jgi:surfactin synthase thioesterase subunit
VTGRSPWLLRRQPRPDASARLYCFPHSGGSAGEFLAWSDALPEWEVWGVQAPGHGGRVDEEPATTMAALVGAMVAEVDLVAPYDLFGHSLGAAVAYELTVALRDLGRPLPRCLYLSAHDAPHVHRPDRSLPSRADDVLLDEVEEQFGPVPPELRDDPDWRALVLGTLRADLRIAADYVPSVAEPLPCAVVAMGGTADQVATRAGLAAWGACTTEIFRLRLYAGGHFYFREHQHDVLRHLAADLARPAGRAVPGAPALGTPAAVPGPGTGAGAGR